MEKAFYCPYCNFGPAFFKAVLAHVPDHKNRCPVCDSKILASQSERGLLIHAMKSAKDDKAHFALFGFLIRSTRTHEGEAAIDRRMARERAFMLAKECRNRWK